MPDLTYRCHEHGWVAHVDREHRSVRFEPPPRGAGRCNLGKLAHLAVDNPKAPLGDQGVWDPRTRRPQCHITLDAEGEVVS